MDLMPQQLEIICPACGVHFALDTAFAGSVCRCSSCGVLIDVQVELPGSDAVDAPRHDNPLHQMTAADIHPTVLVEHRAMAGRSVMAYQRDIPPRQFGKRIAEILLVALIMVTVAGASVYWVTKQKHLPAPANRASESALNHKDLGVDLVSHAALFWGVSLDTPCVVLIDATVASSHWLTDVKEQVTQVHGVLQESDVPVTFAFWNGQAIAIKQYVSNEPLPAVFEQMSPKGQLVPADALGRLSALQMQRVVLVSSQPLTASQVQAMDKVLDANVRLDVIWVGTLPEGLEAVVAQRQGVCVTR
ncbi:MAG: hypothetical protein JKX85_05120 [Phycisphaeraceae bacterium]|nr:hypothetical protein [Phycisphaeraceae bacterium]